MQDAKNWFISTKISSLAQVAKVVLVIPHSNASEERFIAWFVRTRRHCAPALDLIEHSLP